MPVVNTATLALGTQGGTILSRSLRIGPKWATAVKQNIAANAKIIDSCQV
jgi:hypothetical protein